MLTKYYQLKSVLDNSGTLSKGDKEFIKAEYIKVTGTELVTKTKCKSCYYDGLVIIINALNPNKLRMKAGAVISFNGKQYNRLNMTDEIAVQIIASDESLKKYFYGL